MTHKEITKLVRDIERAGWGVRQSGKNYYLVTSPEGEHAGRIPSTPKNPTTTAKRIRKQLKKRGCDL